ncbi:MAG: hypothetical protein M1819_002219 [Sarea resinae]|nr:MAG: hypothetical protein M1819_002219 [Sarea resinae]
MPIKIPKGFTRRKSSGNALEEAEATPAEHSFRVYERPRESSKSFDGGSKLNLLSSARPYTSSGARSGPTAEQRNGIGSNNRGSAGTSNSTSTAGYYDTSSSSARFSSSSTLPSSADIHTSDDHNSSKGHPHTRNSPAPQIPESHPTFSLRAAGRTFSFGLRAPKPPIAAPAPSPLQPQPSDPVSAHPRDRAMTTSSYASTAKPPKLDTDFGLGESGSGGFGDMFESIGKRKSKLLDRSGGQANESSIMASPDATSPPIPAKNPKSLSDTRLNRSLPPIDVNVPEDMESSPRSWDSHDSREGLMSAQGSSITGRSYALDEKSRSFQTTAAVPGPSGREKTEKFGAAGGLRRSSAFMVRTPSMPIDDRDARLVLDSVQTRSTSNQQPGSSRRESQGVTGRALQDDTQPHGVSAEQFKRSTTAPTFSSPISSTQPNNQAEVSRHERQASSAGLFDGEELDLAEVWNGSRGDSNNTTPRAKALVPISYSDDSFHDPSFAASAQLATRYQESSETDPQPLQTTKVMTPAQFERYRQQQDLARTKSNASVSEGSDDGDAYDDEDETERNRSLAKQRRKQEAHLAVYRQQMMKVTGEQPSDLPSLQNNNRPTFERSSASLPNLSAEMSSLHLGVEAPADGAKSSDDEDEDVPLGILAAHGFPHKNRPPTALNNSNSIPNLRAASAMGSYQQRPGSAAGDQSGVPGRSSLPIFAKNLPPDPYYGASIVNPSNRESPSFGRNGGGSVYGAPQPNLPPGGLVGVIAGEERARAMRRGSPNTQGNYANAGLPGGDMYGTGHGMPQQNPAMNAGMPMMPGMPNMPVSPGDQAQIQMSQQMTQMMQMQMQWMEQMMQMQNLQGGQQLPQQQQPHDGRVNSLLAPPGQMQRPMSMGTNASAPNLGGPQLHQRTMSILDPALSLRNNQSPAGFPGLMNNQGYAPSIAPSERSGVGLPSRYRPVSLAPADGADNRSERSTFASKSQGWNDKQGANATVKATIRTVNSRNSRRAGSDEDEDEGWEEMKKKRESRKSAWKTKSQTRSSGLQELYLPGN